MDHRTIGPEEHHHQVRTGLLRSYSPMVLWSYGPIVLLAAAGCVGPFRNPFAPPGPPAPQVLRLGASLPEVIAAVNANTQHVRSYAANGATFTLLGKAGVPALTGSILLERPSRLRVQAGTTLLGQEIDLGSNEQLLWVWLRRNEPRAVYVCRRDQFATSRARQAMPIDPDWLPAALGLVELDPQTPHSGPRITSEGNLEVHTSMASPLGPLTRICVIDPTRAWVLQQHLYDGQGRPLATAVASQHRYFPDHQVSLPARVEIRVPQAQLELAIDVGELYLNAPLSDSAQLWQPPQIDGHPQIDISGGPPAITTPTHVPTAWEPVYRSTKQN